MLKKINKTVSHELARYPRGPRGSAQNLFRAVYQNARTSCLGRKEAWGLSAAECAAWASEFIRQHHPGFSPQKI